MAKKRKKPGVSETMASVSRGSTSVAALDMPANRECVEEIRRYLALCVSGEMILNLRELTKIHVNDVWGIDLTENSVRNWIDKDVLCGPMRDHMRKHVPLPKDVQAYITSVLAEHRKG